MRPATEAAPMSRTTTFDETFGVVILCFSDFQGRQRKATAAPMSRAEARVSVP